MTFQLIFIGRLFRSSLAPQKEQLISSEPIKHFWLGQHSSKILFYICLKIKKNI